MFKLEHFKQIKYTKSAFLAKRKKEMKLYDNEEARKTRSNYLVVKSNGIHAF